MSAPNPPLDSMGNPVFQSPAPQVPYYLAKPGTPSAPPPLQLNPTPAPAPQPVVVDRQAYLNEQLKKQQDLAAMQQAAYQVQQQDVDRLRAIDDYFTKGGEGTFVRGINEAFPSDYQPPEPDRAWYERAAGSVFEGARNVGSTLADLPISPYQSPPRTSGPQPNPRGFAESWNNTAGVDLPYRDQVADVAGQVGRRAGEGLYASVAGPAAPLIEEAAKRTPFTPSPRGAFGKGGEVAFETMVPREVWELALEFIPEVGTVPALVRAARSGSPDALRAVRQALDSPKARIAFEQVIRGESGKLRLPGSSKIVTWKELPDAPQVLDSPIEAYHGTGSKFTAFDEGLMDQTALYGPGVYMTDDAELALSYAKTRAGAVVKQGEPDASGFAKLTKVGEATVQTLKPRTGLRILNMEKPLPRDAAEVFLAKANGLDDSGFVDEAIAAGKSGAQVSREFRTALTRNDLYSYEAGEELAELNDALRAAGYDGIAHTGGIQGGKKHTVTVIFDPKNVEIVTPQTRALAIREKVETALRLAGGESGEMTPGKFVPENVITALKNRNKAVAKNPDELQAAWDVLPPVNQKMITHLADAVLTPAERQAITRAGRARQTARAREAITETAGTTLERAQAGRAALRGRIIPQIKPIGPAFDEREMTDLFGQIDEAFNARTILPQEHGTATDALELLMYGKRPLDPNKPLSLMPHEIKLLGRIFGPEFEAVLPKTKAELNMFDKIIDYANLPRAVIAGIDISAPGRQGIVLAARNPLEWGKAWGPMVKSMLSEGRYTRELERMQTDDYFEDAVLHGIDFTDIGGGAAAEESFQTHLIQSNVFLRNTVGRGERGYTAYLDKLRLSVYKKGAQRLERTATKHNWAPERLDLAKKDWGGFVNHASGRGDLGALNKYVPAANALFFSPRFVISRPQTIYDLVKSDPAVRQMVGENLGAFVGSGVLLLTAAAASGAQVELDPRSSDFGKIRIGDQRIEFWGGFQPLARYVTQIAMGDSKTLDTQELVGVNRWKTVGAFVRSKLSPAGALGWDLLVEGGKNYEGENFLKKDQVDDELMNRLLPLVIQDAIEGYRAQGLGAAITAAGISAVGGGVGTFEPDKETIAKAEKSGQADALKKSGIPFSGNKIDFTRPLLDYGQNRAELAKTLSVDTEGKSLSEIRKAYVDDEDRVERLMARDDISEPVAKSRLGDYFDALPRVKAIKTRAKADMIAYWEAHPQELQDAIDAGLTLPADYKDAILANE